MNELVRAHRKREQALEPAALAELPDPAPAADEVYAGSRTALRVEAALVALPERQRSAILLRVQQDLGHEEIAEVLQTSTSGVKSLLHRARENLATQLKKEIA